MKRIKYIGLREDAPENLPANLEAVPKAPRPHIFFFKNVSLQEAWQILAEEKATSIASAELAHHLCYAGITLDQIREIPLRCRTFLPKEK